MGLHRTAATTLLACTLLPVAGSPPEERTFVASVMASSPVAYYRLESNAGASEAGTTRFMSSGGVSIGHPGAPIAAEANGYAKLDGRDGFIMTTHAGGIVAAGSIMAWVKLARLPAEAGHVLFVAGESQSGNDFDLEFETDGSLAFRTGATTPLRFSPASSELVGRWHMIVATFDVPMAMRALYWDGKLVASDHDPGRGAKAGVFTIGASSFGGNRFFEGGIDEVALWDRALTAAEVRSLSLAVRAS